MRVLSLSQLTDLFKLLAAGMVGGILASAVGLPLPFMMGGVITSVLMVAWANGRDQIFWFPKGLRVLFVGVIGAMIGATFTPELVRILPSLGLSLLAVAVYVLLAHFIGFVICRRFGGYDPQTAFFAALPGGLVEAISLGEKAGGDVRILTLMHFLRLLSVVIIFPLGFFIWSGETVGSAAGQGVSNGPWGWWDVVILLAIAGFGISLGPILRLPASYLLGPMLLSSVLYGSGAIEAHSPNWLLYLAQLVVGVGLGTQFSGASRALFLTAFKVSCLQVTAMSAVSLCLAGLVWAVTDFDFQAMVLSFAPGGVSEMGLIALSLSISPVIVAAHHIFRICVTVIVAILAPAILPRLRG